MENEITLQFHLIPDFGILTSILGSGGEGC